MTNEVEKWIKQAEKDFETAQKNYKIQEYNITAFMSHQTIEKALKALYIKQYNALLKIHDLSLLAKKVNAPEKIIEICNKINPVYIDTRYPDFKSYTEKDAQEIIKMTKEVFEWIKKIL